MITSTEKFESKKVSTEKTQQTLDKITNNRAEASALATSLRSLVEPVALTYQWKAVSIY